MAINLHALKGKKGAVFLLGGSAAVVGFLWYRHRQASAASSASPADATTTGTAADASGIDPTTGVPYSQEMAANTYGGIDPATGIPYAEELSATGGLGGFGTSGLTTGGAQGPTGLTGPAGPAGPSPHVPRPHTNAQWATDAEDHLTPSHGAQRNALAAALGKYISGQAMTPEQESLANSAISYLGYPPVRGTGGFPPAMRTQASGGQGGRGKVKVPNVQGMQFPAASKALASAGLKARAVPRPVGIVAFEVPSAGHDVSHGSTVALHMAATG
jgi:hypothetical protein